MGIAILPRRLVGGGGQGCGWMFGEGAGGETRVAEGCVQGGGKEIVWLFFVSGGGGEWAFAGCGDGDGGGGTLKREETTFFCGR